MSAQEQIISIVKKIKSPKHLKHLLNIANIIYKDYLKSEDSGKGS